MASFTIPWPLEPKPEETTNGSIYRTRPLPSDPEEGATKLGQKDHM